MKINAKRLLSEYPDFISGMALVIVGSLFLAGALRLPFGTISAPDAGFFPTCLSVMLLLFASAIIVKSFSTNLESVEFDAGSRYVMIAIAALLLYAATVETIGYLFCTFLMMLLLLQGFGGMSWIRSFLIAIPSVVLSYVGFIKLGVPLPRGILPF